MKGIFSVLVENKEGVLSAISGLFARRGYNIDSLAVGETDDRSVSSMTIVSTGDQRTIDQIEKQLNKQVDVIKVRRLEENRCISLEMMLIRVSYTPTNRGGLIEIHADPETIGDFIELVRSYGILEVQRTGTISMTKV